MRFRDHDRATVVAEWRGATVGFMSAECAATGEYYFSDGACDATQHPLCEVFLGFLMMKWLAEETDCANLAWPQTSKEPVFAPWDT